MQTLQKLYDLMPTLLPILAAVAVVTATLALAHWVILRRRPELGAEGRMPRQLAMLLLTILAMVCAVLAMPMESSTRNQLLSIIGVGLTAVIALSSTTFVANAMAGLMLRMVNSFRPGDFVRIGGQFGRITERGLFHTEIQTEDRDLTTFPNLYLVSNPLTVLHSSGTIVSTTLSLGYDVSHCTVEPLLVQAAKDAELQEPFVHLTQLGDFSVTYRVAGLLAKTKHLLTTRSKLRRLVLDSLHAAGIEICSPTFMNQRVLPSGEPILPEETPGPSCRLDDQRPPEDMIFDKAIKAEKLERLLELRSEGLAKIKELKAKLLDADEVQGAQLQSKIDQEQRRASTIESAIENAEKNKAKAD